MEFSSGRVDATLPSCVPVTGEEASAGTVQSQIQMGTSTHWPGVIRSMAATIPSTRASMRGQDVDIRTSTDSRRAARFYW